MVRSPAPLATGPSEKEEMVLTDQFALRDAVTFRNLPCWVVGIVCTKPLGYDLVTANGTYLHSVPEFPIRFEDLKPREAPRYGHDDLFVGELKHDHILTPTGEKRWFGPHPVAGAEIAA